jgi:3-deoxy-manno-octulosonate cytidylyltransferase (CMP-KDO synthetase)
MPRFDPRVQMTTLAHPLRNVEELLTPHVVKVVVDRAGDALYFSRAPIPYDREFWPRLPSAPAADAGRLRVPPGCHRHLGLYAYRREVVLRLAKLQPTTLEQVEQLEQLRALEHGYRIRVVPTTYESIGVDTPEDVVRAERVLARQAARQRGAADEA